MIQDSLPRDQNEIVIHPLPQGSLLIVPWKCLFLLPVLFLINYLLRYPAVKYGSFINDDAALILGSDLVRKLGVAHYFYDSYGPSVIRPFQLIGMYIEYYLLGLNAQQMYFCSLVILSCSQSILLYVLTRYVGFWVGIFSTLSLGASYIAAEPVLWISDRHDLYLLLFFSLSLLATQLFWSARSLLQALICLIVLTMSLWGGFYSNEKGVALPPIVVVLSAIPFVAGGRSFKDLSWWAGCFAITCGMSLVGYFGLRYAVLGQFIGGYNNKVLPDDFGCLRIYYFLRNLFLVPVRPASDHSLAFYPVLLLLGALLGPIPLWLAARAGETRRLAILYLVASASLVTAGLPTLQYLSGEALHGGSRFMWLPHVIAFIWTGVAVGYSLSKVTSRFSRLGLMLSSFVLLVHVVNQGRHGTLAYASAHRFTRQVQSLFAEHCSCVDLQNPQTSGLPTLYAGINTFTELVWIEYEMHLLGTPTCQPPDPRCHIRFSTTPEGTPVANDVRSSR